MDSKGEQSRENDIRKLYSACRRRVLDFIEQLSSLGLDIDLPDSSGRALLMIAAYVGEPYLFDFLIARGSDHTLKDNHHGESLLHFAAAGGSNDIIEKLLFLGLDIDSRDNKGQTPLMTAALCNRPESFRFLIEKGSDPLLKDNDGKSVLFWARRGLRKGTVKKLLSPSLTPFQKLQTAIILAISKYDESSSMLFARDVDRRDGTGYGQLFQLKNENGFMWENGCVRAEKLQFGSVVTYWDYGDFNRCKCTYWFKAANEPQVGEHTNRKHHVTQKRQNLQSKINSFHQFLFNENRYELRVYKAI